ncbi:sporulation protein [Actinokineospora auranticolor]|uniref:Sporulation-control protein n=1 Tax=Actinokineospora auranticolor TaxID=155976 RepID=A0A2S6H005_9PSEU|nr:sporulation protein [Actinokineospora auranticolor]PPK70832.1 sporulation-control protein [Actinokineospora auranticolor]
MVFKKMLRALGVGGPSVDTVLTDSRVHPGGVLTGEVRLTGGEAHADIDYVALSLVTRVERSDDSSAPVEFDRAVVAGRFALPAGAHHSIPFQLPVPWETPVTEVFGSHLHGMALGLRTELAVAKAVDKGDQDPVHVVPLGSQAAVLAAFGDLGFRFKSADLEAGRIHGVHQQLPFFQEIEFYPPPHLAGGLSQVELTFVTDPHGLAVVLEADRRSGLFRQGGDAYGRFHVSHHDAERTDWRGRIEQWLHQVSSTRHNPGHGHGFHGGHGGHGGHEGPGVGGVVAGAAAGIVGGMVLGEVFEGIGDFFGGDDD